MKTKNKQPEFLIGLPDGPIDKMEMSWAKWWINIWDNGNVGYQGYRPPTAEEKEDIKKRITKYRELLEKKIKDLDTAWELMK